MNTKLLLSIGLLATVSTYAIAQDVVQIDTGTQEIVVNSDFKEPQLIQVELIRDPQTGKVIARLAETKANSNVEISKLMLEGQTVESDMNGKKKVQIVWDTASLIDEESGEKKSTPITMPFKSEVIAQPELETGDAFNAEGDPIELMLAYQRLMQKEAEEEGEEEIAVQDNDETEKSGAPQEREQPEREPIATPDFEVNDDAEPVITTQLCPIKVDIAQEVAIVMEETLVDGVSEGGCQETLTRYPLNKSYNSCPVTPDIDEMLVYPAYTLSYTDPESGQIQVQDCTDDPEEAIALTETTEGCGIFHDFGTGISTQQTKLTYPHKGVVQTLQTCQNSDVTYEHVVTRNGCEPIVNSTDETVTFTERTLIDVDGSTQEILGCQPNASTTIAISSEECTGGNRYTHNFDSNQSFLNKTYFYNDPDAGRVNVLVCEPSAETFAHQIDESLCTPTNDDTNRTTRLRGKPVIDDGGQVVIGQCQDIDPIVPYSEVASVWKINASTLTSLALTGDDGRYWTIPMSYNPNSNAPINKYFKVYSGSTWMTKDNKWRIHNGMTTNAYGYCVRGAVTGDWSTQSGVTIDKANSTTTPTFSRTATPSQGSFVNNGSHKITSGYSNASTTTVTFNCSAPQCQLTTLRLHPKFLRGDNSEFIDTSISTDVKYVCGDGSNLDGQEQ